MSRCLFLLSLCLLLAACQSQNEEKAASATIAAVKLNPQAEPSALEQSPPPAPPTPPLFEDFQSAPQLSLFPRASGFRPEDDDSKGMPFWRTYIDHLLRTSGPTKPVPDMENIAFAFRAIKGIESVGFFSPMAVTPNTNYEISALISCDLGDGASAGIAVLEFNKFLWIGTQFSKSLVQKHQVGGRPEIKLHGKTEQLTQQSVTFTTGPTTQMIHLVFYRNGNDEGHDRNPVLIDDIKIVEVKGKS